MAPLSKLTLTIYQPHPTPATLSKNDAAKPQRALEQHKLVLAAALKGQEHFIIKLG